MQPYTYIQRSQAWRTLRRPEKCVGPPHFPIFVPLPRKKTHFSTSNRQQEFLPRLRVLASTTLRDEFRTSDDLVAILLGYRRKAEAVPLIILSERRGMLAFAQVDLH